MRCQRRLIKRIFGHVKTHKGFVGGGLRAFGNRAGLRNPVKPLHHRVDRIKFDPEATDFNLRIHPAQKPHHARFCPHRQITGPVERHVFIPGRWHKGFGAQRLIPKIAQSKPGPRSAQLPFLPVRDRVELLIDDMHLRAGDRLANRQRLSRFEIGFADLVTAGEGGVLGRPIAVDYGQFRAMLLDPRNLDR